MLSDQAKEVTRRADGCDSSARPAPKPESDLLGAFWSGIYSALWYPALPFALLAVGGDVQSRRERLGSGPPEAEKIGGGKLRIWVHAASVGEIEGVRPVLRSLAHLRPDLEFVITTMTPTGRDAARRRLDATCQLAPFDHAATVSRFIWRLRPVLLINTETELWPNYFLQSAAAGVRIALINARLSSRSMNRYRFIRPLIAHALKQVNLVLAQTADDAARFCRLGAVPERVAVTGNAKYEIVGDSLPLRSTLTTFTEGRPILIAGSTGPGEEQIVLTAFGDLVRRFPSLALVLAPRHLQRIDEVERILRAAGLFFTRASESNPPAPPEDRRPKTMQGSLNETNKYEDPIPPPDQREVRWGLSGKHPGQDERHFREAEAHRNFPADPQVLLLDTMGELGPLYRRATLAFVGGSLLAGRGGQSLAEPANASVPVLFGPYYENHRQLGDALIAAKAGRVVRDSAQLADAGAKWLADEAARAAAGKRARSVMEQLAGSTTITVRHLCALLPASQ